MLKIAGHPNGRVFMAGKDGNLYELTYTVAYGFLYSVFFVGDPAGSRKCERLKHRSSCGPRPFNSLLAVFGVRGAPRTLVDVVVDPLRNLVYTLDLEGKIDMFDLGADGNGTTGQVRRDVMRCDAMRHDVTRCDATPTRSFFLKKIRGGEKDGRKGGRKEAWNGR